MSPIVEPNESNASDESAESSPTRRAVISAAGASIVSVSLPSAVRAASAGGAEGLSSGTGIIASAIQGPSNTTVTPTTVSVSGVNYNVYRFTQDGSFTVSGGSLNADVLLIGGGAGGGGGYFGGGGGAGEVLPLTSKSFVAGNYVVTIGQGGASATDGSPSKITYGSGAVTPGATWESEARRGLKGLNGTETSDGTGGKSGDQFNGGLEAGGGGGGGGGSTAVGANASSNFGAAGGAGESVTGYWTSTLSVGGGGGGGGYFGGGSATNGGGTGGRAGGGVGAGTAGTDGTGGGGGGGYDGSGSAGGDGAIYVRILA